MIWLLCILGFVSLVSICMAIWYKTKWESDTQYWKNKYLLSKEQYKNIKKLWQENVSDLKSHLPKRDSKGRFCKRIQ